MGKLDDMVRMAASTPISDVADVEKRQLHKDICTKLVEVSDREQVPMSFLVYFMVSKEAHKQSTFDKGYTKCDETKAAAVIKMSKAFAEFHGYGKPSDKVYHAMTAFYERKSQDYAEFEKILSTMTPNKKWATTKSICTAMGMK